MIIQMFFVVCFFLQCFVFGVVCFFMFWKMKHKRIMENKNMCFPYSAIFSCPSIDLKSSKKEKLKTFEDCLMTFKYEG